METLRYCNNIHKLSLAALLLLLALGMLALWPSPAYSATQSSGLPLPQLYVASLPEQAQAALPERVITSDRLRLRSGCGAECMWQTDLPAGSVCYLISAWAGQGLYHRILTGKRTWYVSTAELDLSGGYGYVFNAQQDMHTLSGYSAAELESQLQGGLSGLGACFAAAEQKYGVNALLMIAICRLESGWADSYLAENYHNLAGLGGSGGWLRFSSHGECIDYLAQVLSERYLNPDSAFYNGCTIAGICRTYCGGSGHWTKTVTHYMKQLNEALLAAGKATEAVAVTAEQ